MVRTKGLEPSHTRYQNLNLARLPIPPRPRIATRGTAGAACGGFLIAPSYRIATRGTAGAACGGFLIALSYLSFILNKKRNPRIPFRMVTPPGLEPGLPP